MKINFKIVLEKSRWKDRVILTVTFLYYTLPSSKECEMVPASYLKDMKKTLRWGLERGREGKQVTCPQLTSIQTHRSNNFNLLTL